jgi:aspartate carbamoyltransferase catalytic subunit
VALNRQKNKKLDLLSGRTLINLFFEASTRTQSSFELAGKRLGADVVNMSPRASSIVKGETLVDTAVTLNAMKPDILVIRHGSSGAASLLSQKVSCSVINAGDGQHEHPSQALLDVLSMRRAFGRVDGLTVAICGDVLHSRVARSNVALLTMLGAHVRLVGPPTLMPADVGRWGVEWRADMKSGIAGADVVMMLRLQLERMQGDLVPSMREYFRLWGLDREKLARAAPGARVMHPGPMNRGVEIDSDVADDLDVSLIQDQVEMGVAVRMAILASLAARLDNR